MKMRIFCLILLVVMTVSCYQQERDNSRVGKLVTACVQAQVSISNPMWESGSMRLSPTYFDEYVVQVLVHESLEIHHVIIAPRKPYPGAPVARCRIEKKTYCLLHAAYSLGELDALRKEVDFIEHSPRMGLDERELEDVIQEAEWQVYSLSDYLPQ